MVAAADANCCWKLGFPRSINFYDFEFYNIPEAYLKAVWFLLLRVKILSCVFLKFVDYSAELNFEEGMLLFKDWTMVDLLISGFSPYIVELDFPEG